MRSRQKAFIYPEGVGYRLAIATREESERENQSLASLAETADWLVRWLKADGSRRIHPGAETHLSSDRYGDLVDAIQKRGVPLHPTTSDDDGPLCPLCGGTGKVEGQPCPECAA